MIQDRFLFMKRKKPKKEKPFLRNSKGQGFPPFSFFFVLRINQESQTPRKVIGLKFKNKNKTKKKKKKIFQKKKDQKFCIKKKRTSRKRKFHPRQKHPQKYKKRFIFTLKKIRNLDAVFHFFFGQKSKQKKGTRRRGEKTERGKGARSR